MMYVIDDDDRVNVALEECRQRVLSQYTKWVQQYGGHPRIPVLAMLTVLADLHQRPGLPFDPQLAHNLCQKAHEVAMLVCAHHMTPEELAAAMGLEQDTDPDSGESNTNKHHLH